MIDWFGLFHSALWVLGAAIALASLSYADWRRRLAEPPVGFRQAIAGHGFLATFSLGLTLFCAGLAIGASSWWQIAGWALLALGFGWLALRSWRRSRRDRSS
jgi:hypothetical protein